MYRSPSRQLISRRAPGRTPLAAAAAPLRLGVIYTGGTIGCVGEPLSPLGQADFQRAFAAWVTPVLAQQSPGIDVRFLPFGATLDSTNLQPHDWCKMAALVLEAYTDHDVFLILHGTDTMAWSASALSFLLTGIQPDGLADAVLSKPVILTGSQLPLFYQPAGSTDVTGLLFNTDALQNVCGAVQAGSFGPPEVCLFFDYKLLRGNRSVKTDASEFGAFSSPNHPGLGGSGMAFTLYNDRVRPLPTTPRVALDDAGARARCAAQLAHIRRHIDSAIVLPFLAFPAPYDAKGTPATSAIADMLRAALACGVQGLILESYGAGNFPSGDPSDPENGAIYQVLKDAHDAGVVILDCTQVTAGTVNSTAYAAGSWLSEVGAVGCYDMTAVASLSKLIVLLSLRGYQGRAWERGDIERLLLTNLAGEIMDVDRLDTRGDLFLAPTESIVALDGTVELTNSPEDGPVLQRVPKSGEDPEVLWRALDAPGDAAMPGRLYMQGDGDLVFYDSSNVTRYASGTARDGEATSMLVVEGDTARRGARLFIYNYARGEVARQLYPSVDEQTQRDAVHQGFEGI